MNFRRSRAVDKLGKFMVPAASHAKNMQPLSLVAQGGGKTPNLMWENAVNKMVSPSIP